MIQLVHNGYCQVNFIKSKSGVLRGGHYHKRNDEAFYVISGEFRLLLEDMQSNVKENYLMTPGVFFKIKKGIKHSFEFRKPTKLISMYSVGVVNPDGTKDIYSD